MKNQISPGAMIGIIVVVLAIIAVIAWKMLSPPPAPDVKPGSTTYPGGYPKTTAGSSTAGGTTTGAATAGAPK